MFAEKVSLTKTERFQEVKQLESTFSNMNILNAPHLEDILTLLDTDVKEEEET